MNCPIQLDWAKSASKFADLCRKKGFEPPEINSVQDLARWALQPQYSTLILACFRPIYMHIVAQWLDTTSSFNKTNVFNSLCFISRLFPEICPLIEHFLMVNPEILESPRPILHALYQLLSYFRSRFVVFINPTAVYQLIQDEQSETRALAVLVLGLYIGVSEKLVDEWLVQYCGSDAAVRYLPVQQALINCQDTQYASDADFEVDELPLLANVGGLLIPKLSLAPSLPTHFIATPTSITNIRRIGEALLLNKPVLLKGAPGSGKTFYVECLAQQLRSDSDITRIHLGEQTDSKALIGTYSTGEKPGTFEWKQGVLTAAVTQGKWVLIEDLDKAPNDVISTLLPLLEKRELLIPSRDETLTAKHGFQLFATISTSSRSHHEIIGQRLWDNIEILAPTDSDLIQILQASFPEISGLAQQFVQVYLTLFEVYEKKSNTRPISSRDLFKWAARTTRIVKGIQSGDAIPTELYDNIFREAVRCFTSFSDNKGFVLSIAEIIGEILEIGTSKVLPLLTHYVPHITENDETVTIGCANLDRRPVSAMLKRKYTTKCQNFATTNHGVRLLEEIAVATAGAEPILLSGETGTGKTTVVQHLANMTCRKLVVINISQQMEASDLIGGFKPLDVKMLAGTLLEEFDELFDSTFSRTKNQQFCNILSKALAKNSWKNVVKLWREAFKMVQNLSNRHTENEQDPPVKKRRLDSVNMVSWREFMDKVSAFEARSQELQNAILFQFIEGLLIKAVRRGDWVLLDEINLAPADTLEGIADLLNNPPSLTLLEKGGDEVVKAHPEFRLFACMNAATDFGKKDLPEGIRSRFTELYVRSPDEDIDDLRFIIEKYIGRLKMGDALIVNDVAELFLAAKRLSNDHSLVDGAGQRPHFSIRTLSRTLSYSGMIAGTYGLRRALYEGFCMCFLTLLDKASSATLEPLIFGHILSKVGNAKSLLSLLPAQPDSDASYIQFKHYWIRKGEHECVEDSKYIITPSVEANLLNLVRATATKKFPVLIQGPTSSGKTSMIKYLANKTGHKFVRINNHEHTDIQEYLGTYVTDKNGVLKFQEGVLVEAVRNGYWIVLDELNLAPTDVLEALNRLLDDNREILIPETQEVLTPHPDFMLFATQNPPGVYAGRKILSRAFRNRFLELHFDDIPQDELELILKDRCQIAPSYAKKIVDVYKDLAARRQSTRVFEQKNSFATLRDLFRWALREAVGYEQLAFNGYLLLCERVRSASEKQVVRDSIEKVMRVKINVDYEAMAPADIIAQSSQVIWTKAMKRLLVLVVEALKQNEPVLLVGETGCGKTTVCQVLSEIYKIPLNIINAHQNTETGDLIGSQRPVRNRAEYTSQLSALLEPLFPGLSFGDAKEAYKKSGRSIEKIDTLMAKTDALFEWVDGPLVSSMKSGSYFLLDEISLADDSVLERLNSVLEPERSLLLPEKGSDDIHVVGSSGFQFFATMNPGGDYGKKELSPALRNRFTEIWVPSMEDFDDVALIVEAKLVHKEFTRVITEFSKFFAEKFGYGDVTSGVISLRDILNWVQFVNCAPLEPSLGVFHGGCMVFIDSIGSNALSHLANSSDLLKQSRADMVSQLCKYIGKDYKDEYFNAPKIEVHDAKVDFGYFALERIESQAGEPFSLQAPTTAMNAMRVIRSMTIDKPILLEGSPGVGKTSLVSAIAAITGHKLTRINLSDQTDLADLFGSDAPAEGSNAGEFTWRDAPFLRALQQGEWVLLDEMNLAPQQVLEGLNACLDHRGEAYIPELDRTFKRHTDFRVFAAQNPQAQGGGRKGLPKSFVNRFSVVYMDSLILPDLETITAHLYPQIPKETSLPLVALVEELNSAVGRSIGLVGQPFEFNLRDTMRWFSLCQSYGLGPVEFFNLIVVSRFRTKSDRAAAWDMYGKYFDDKPSEQQFSISASEVIAGHSTSMRNSDLARIQSPLQGHLQCNTHIMESAITCIQQNWPLILVGPTRSGKTSFLRYLAYLFGFQLKEFSMSADVDSTDLLGGFDQVERGQQLAFIWARIEELVEMGLESENIALLEATRSRNLVHAKQLLASNDKISSLIDEYESSNFDIPKFKWIDGVLVRAIESGHWLVLDNANLCNPSVLDRLNSLLEVNGSLYINECAEANGEPRKVVAHPNFRLFMTVDPKYGELSRAMRNRGVEVFVDSLETRSTEFDKQVLKLPSGDLNIAELSLESRIPAISMLPVMNSNLHAFTLFTDLAQKTNGHWVDLMLLSSSTTALISGAPRFDNGPIDGFFAFIRKYAEQLTFDRNPIRTVSRDDLFQVKVKCIVMDLKSRLENAVQCAATVPQSAMNPVELSILSRTKTSIHCLDAYSFLFTALETVDWSNNLQGLQVLLQFANLLFQKDFDQSKVPIFRDLLESHAGDKALQFINLHFDFSRGGAKLEELWRHVSVGFSSKEDWKLYTRLMYQVEAFDTIAQQCSSEEHAQISSIRESLCMFIADIQRGNSSNAGLIDIIEASVHSLKPVQHKSAHFSEAFNTIKATVRLNHWAAPSSETLSLLRDLEFYTANNTTDLSYDYNTSSGLLPALDHHNDFMAPVFAKMSSLDQVAGVVFNQALHEMETIAAQLEKNAHHLGYKNYNGLRERLFNNFGDIVATDGLDLLGFAQALVTEALPWCVYDPAIRQHVLYENFKTLSRDADSDIAHWKAARSVFIADTPTTIDAMLQQNKDLLEVQPAPSIYRPRESRIERIFAEISSIRTMIEPSFYANMSEEQLVVWNGNMEKVIDRLRAYTDYKDLVEVFRSVLLTLKFAVNLKYAREMPSLLWLLNPVKTSLDANMLLYQFKSSRAYGQALNSVQIHLLRASQYFGYSEIQELCDTVFENLYRTWTAKRLVDQEKAEADAKDFKQGDEESSLEEDFYKLFPDYEGEVPEIELRNDDAELCAAYFYLFDETKEDLTTNLEHVVDAFKNVACGPDSAAAFPAVILALKGRIATAHAKVGDNFNFYLEPSHAEARNAIEFANSVYARISELLERWPEHETLLTLARSCQEVLEYAAFTPVARYLQKVEQIHHYLDEWQKFASKDSSVLPLIERVSALIVTWRRLELRTWPSLFEHEKTATKRSTASFWYYLYENLVFNPTKYPEAVDYSEIVRVLILFISGSTIGQFEYRVRLVRAFAAHAAIVVPKVADCIHNVLGFYSQYAPTVAKMISDKETALAKDIKEVILLASWRDVNIASLKQSAQRSHRSLYKIVRKYRDFVNKPLSELLSNEPAPSSSSIDAQVFNVSKDSLLDGVSEESVDTKPKHLRNIPKRTEMMIDYSEQACRGSIPDLLDLATTTNDEARRLRDATPSFLTEENKKEVNALRVEKGRLLTETLKALKESGLGTNIKSQVIEDQTMLSKVLSETAYLRNSDYFYRIVELLPRLRSAAQSSESDVPATDLKRGMAFTENLISLLLKQRWAIHDAFESSLDDLNTQLLAMRDLTGDLAIKVQGGTVLNRLSNVVKFIYQSGGPAQFAQVASDLEVLSNPVLTTEKWFGRVTQCFEKLRSGAASANAVNAAISRDLVGAMKLPNVDARSTAVATIDANIVEFSSAVLIVIQESLAIANEIDNLAEEKWLIQSTSLLKKLGKVLRVTKMTKKLSVIVDGFKTCVEPSDVPRVLATLIPFASIYCDLVRVLKSRIEVNLFNNTRGTYELMKLLQSLASQGFCSPQEESNEEHDTSQMQSGTGLGDGEGAQTSKNEDDEEQQPDLDDIAQQANQDQKQKDDDQEEDNAIEMEGDMAGELEDYENKESDAEDEDKDQEDLDDEVGDIDDLDPNAVDEKMWDDETNSKKEKETDENVNGEEGDMEAGDEDPKDSRDESSKADDGEDEEGDDAESEGEAAQDDEVQAGAEELENNVEERDALDLPEDMQLESGEEDGEDADGEDAMQDDLDVPEEQESDEAGVDEADETTNEPADDSGDDDPNLEGIRDAGEEAGDDEQDADDAEGENNGEDEAENEDGEPEPEAVNDADAGDADDAMDVDTEGLHGPDQSEQVDEQQTTRSEQKSEMSGEGANQEVTQEQDAMDTGETAAATTQEQPERDQQAEQNRKENSETLKQLGDALKEFYDRQKDIQDRTERDDEAEAQKDVNVNPDEVEHVGDADDFDAQALGKVSEDVNQDVDKEMAIEENEEKPQVDDADAAPQVIDDEPNGEGDGEGEAGDVANAGDPDHGDPDPTINLPGDGTAEDNHEMDEDEVVKAEPDLVSNEPSRSLAEARDLWKSYDMKTHDLSLVLCEQLRLILEPTLATKLRGDYKTGKRLNMKRIIPFIASNFKKDKIWLRRTKPSKREYQVLIAVDDSKSMGEPLVVDLAFQAIALVANALTQVEAGDLAIARFGNDAQVVHPFGSQFNAGAGAQVLRYFSFDQDRTDVCRLLDRSLEVFETQSSAAWRLEIIISDGVCEDHERLRRLVREAHDNHIMLVFVVLDALNKDGSILDMSQVNYTTDESGNMQLKVDRYMEHFPFDYYVIVRNIQDLPHVMASVLRQYFQAVE